MRRPRGPLFVAPRVYRQRRLRDCARILPVFGAVLLLAPFLHVPPEGRTTAWDGIYIFVVWTALILGARLLASGLDSGRSDRDDPPEG